MKNTTILLTTALAALGCNNTSPDASDPPFEGTPSVQSQPGARIAAAPVTNVTEEPAKLQFSVASSRARGLVPGGLISRRAAGARITTATLARITFAGKDDGSTMRAAAERLLASPKFGLAATELRSLKLSADEGMLKLPVSGGSAVAYSVPESGTFTLKQGRLAEHASVVKTAEDAVSAALEGIAKHALLSLSPQESLDVVGVTARFRGAVDDHGPVGEAEKVGYQVFLGRLYRGTQVLGPPSLVTLDSDGDVATFRKGWRDITGESGSMDVAPEATIDTRRDPLMVRYLTLKESSCGYTEDPDPGSVQGSAGAGCHYVYQDAEARQAMNAQVDEWVNASSDPSVPMLGVRKTPAATQ